MSKVIQKVKPVHCFFPITRVDDEKREVTAYAFVNEVVDGEGGVRLKRTAMEAATPDYMEWANIREMHQPNAAGVASEVVWDPKGAQMTLRVVDDAAWEKCRTGVYKGLSVGVRPTLMRGKEVEKCLWFETSLVDRPKDRDARFIVVRAEGTNEAEEFDVEVEDVEPLERAAAPVTFGTLVAKCEPETLRSLAFDLLRSLLWRYSRKNVADRETLARESIQQFADYVVPLVVAAGERDDDVEPDYYYAAQPELTRLLATDDLAPELRELLADVQRSLPTAPTDADELNRIRTEQANLLHRVETLSTENGTLLQRAEAAETEVATVRGELSSATERIQKLEAEPAPMKAPVRYPQALDREFLVNRQEAANAQVTALQTELQRLVTELPAEADQAKKREGVIRLNVIRQELAQHGIRG